MSVISRREWMKQGLKATAYVAPAVISLSPAPAGAQVTGGCRLTFTATPASSSSIAYGPLLQGTGFTPNGTIAIGQLSNFQAQCRGLIVIPGTSRFADAFGNFSETLPKTALSFSVVTSWVPFPATTTSALMVTDVATGCTAFFAYTITPPTASPADSLTLLYVTNPVSSPLAPAAPPVPGESGSGSVILGQCHVSTGVTELRFTLTGATPNRTFTLFITPSGGPPAVAVGRTVTTDAAGNASFAAYITPNNNPGFGVGSSCLPNLSSATLSLSIDGNPPGANNVAYRATLIRNDIPPC